VKIPWRRLETENHAFGTNQYARQEREETRICSDIKDHLAGAYLGAERILFNAFENAQPAGMIRGARYPFHPAKASGHDRHHNSRGKQPKWQPQDFAP
jgi:hypothetical protein